ncbi:tRNA1(Val) (adenine(37)-N6)-methyltransferase [Fusobacterium necrophorum]|uniref:DNA methyltransferase n=1 Tax=Fusobacterium necrophorum BL TaxID=1441732 RepID=A0AB73BUC6_9FUSO|nr:tRNA1(Val) (adenine(37)-N6)-methyltransferase [Fusobacterium necrophorum]AYZ72808.1 tRNA1(Val) (adenine(37)-N6)-methyltransferase [Fusobacterium necrophorum]AZW09194.1 tRNA1(Val) (adenine(37)-N6)-methyltransferase [Fusobacterium necrophorum subsp. necrophorum]KDE61345.1 DNA methyltransferase [Fusobacterium necrophorum BL]SDB40555.1 tRNA1(Val) A37 N6-methylase TrmN6 [Fusobacterium necrophorum]SQD10201.1 tRNA1(Val) (adenine(37)-N6)-methyltransferase [Fusobacterium necrophorum subsp. necrophor
MEQETTIDLLKKGLKIIQRNDCFHFSLDSLLISEFIKINKRSKTILDLGTGNAAIPLFLSLKTTAQIYGLEIQQISYDLAIKNIALNHLEEQVHILHGDMKNWECFFSKNSFDIVVSNPPFFEFHGNKSLLNDLEQLTLARHEISITLEELIQISSILVKEHGYFYLVHRADRLADILELCRKYKLEPKRLQFCHTKRKNNAKILLLEAVKYGKASLQILPPLFANKEEGGYSEEILNMFEHKGGKHARS